MTDQERYLCSCCGYLTLPEPGGHSDEICAVCYWQDDQVDNRNTDILGPNHVTLTEARQNYRSIGASEARFLPFVRQPLAEELSPTPLIGVVLVHWEGSDSADTEECLRSLAAVDYSNVRAYLVNNGAVTFPEDRFRAALPGLTIITVGENLGYTGGNNLGIRAVLADGAAYVMLLNNDAVVSPDLFRQLLPAFERPDVGIVGPIITYADRPDRAWFAGGRYNRYLGYTFQTRRSGDGSSGHGQDAATDYVTGCALLARREVFERVGLFWDALFLYFEDVELCLRAGRAGYRCELIGQPLVRHRVSASMGAVGDHPFSTIKGYYLGRNPLLMLWRGAAGSWAVVALLGLCGVIYPYNILQCLKARNWPALCSYLCGIRDGFLGRRGPRR